MCLTEVDKQYHRTEWKEGPMKGYKVVIAKCNREYSPIYRAHIENGEIISYKVGGTYKAEDEDTFHIESDCSDEQGRTIFYDTGFHVYKNIEDAVFEYRRHRTGCYEATRVIEVEGRFITAIGIQIIHNEPIMSNLKAEVFVCREMKILREVQDVLE